MSDTLALSTVVAPPKKFTVDGSEYHMLSMDHLSKEDEAEVMALFARHAYISQELELAPNVGKGREHATRLRTCRLSLLTKLTDMPRSLAEQLPLGAQAQLLEAVEAQMAEQEEKIEDEDLAGGNQDATPEVVPSDPASVDHI